ncbi:MAG: thiolase family protein [Planctomycetaceae bacterium]
MNNAYLLSACRTPIGKFRSAFSSLPATDLGALAAAAAIKRAGIGPADVNEIIMGEVLTAGVGQAPARQVAWKAGLSPEVAALTINKVCGSGLKAVMLASQAVRCGDAEVVLAGGMESMSRAGFLLPRESPAFGNRTLIDSMEFDGLTCGLSRRSMGDIAEGLAESAGISREDQDRYALESHCRALAAQSQGLFRDEIIPVTVRTPKGTVEISQDEGPRPDTTFDKLSRLSPAFRQDGTVTAGNASMISDGAAALVVASGEFVDRHHLKPLARIVASATSGGLPEDVFTAPVAAIQQVVQRAGLSLDQVDLFEINEAFAVEMLACLRQLQVSEEKVNVHGGAIALGHPIGASGARVLVTLLHTLRQRRQRVGVAALCLGGGNAVAMVVELA